MAPWHQARHSGQSPETARSPRTCRHGGTRGQTWGHGDCASPACTRRAGGKRINRKKKKKSHRDSSATARYLREKAGTSPHRRAEVQRVLSQPFPGAARRGPARPQPRRGGRGSGHGAALPPLRARVASALRAPPAALSSAPRLGFAPLPSPGERRRPPQPSRSRSRARGAALRPRLGAAPVPVPLNYRT